MLSLSLSLCLQLIHSEIPYININTHREGNIIAEMERKRAETPTKCITKIETSSEIPKKELNSSAVCYFFLLFSSCYGADAHTHRERKKSKWVSDKERLSRNNVAFALNSTFATFPDLPFLQKKTKKQWISSRIAYSFSLNYCKK